MPWSLTNILWELPVFTLVLLRVSGLFLTAPFFSSRIVPVRVRVAMIMVLGFIAFPIVARLVPGSVSLEDVVTGAPGELMVGAVMGLALTAFVAAADLGGLMVGQQAGIVLGEIVDPTQNNRSSIVGQVYSIGLMMVFLLLGGHRAVIAALLDTYKVIPIFAMRVDDSVLLLLTEALAASFIVGIRIAAPVLIALFLVGTAMGFLSRTMPQMNILTVGFSVRSLIAMGTAGVALSACKDLFANGIVDMMEAIRAASWFAGTTGSGVT